MRPHVAPFFRCVAERVAQHVREIVPHQQRFVLVDGQPRLALAAGKLEPHAAAGHAVHLHQLDDLLVDPQPRILQVHRVDGMIRHRHADADLRHLGLAREADDAGETAARAAVGDAVEIDEADRLLRAVHVADARAEARRHEGEVRVGVARLDGALLRRQIVAPIELIVFVAGALGKHGPEHLDVRGDGILLARQTRREALLEITRRRVKRVIEVSRIDVEQVAMRRPQPFANVDDVEPGPRRELERDLDRSGCHSGVRRPSVTQVYSVMQSHTAG